MNMNIKIKVINQITGHVEIDSQIEVNSTWETLSENHKVFREVFPDCQVNFYTEDNESMSMIFAPALNTAKLAPDNCAIACAICSKTAKSG